MSTPDCDAEIRRLQAQLQECERQNVQLREALAIAQGATDEHRRMKRVRVSYIVEIPQAPATLTEVRDWLWAGTHAKAWPVHGPLCEHHPTPVYGTFEWTELEVLD